MIKDHEHVLKSVAVRIKSGNVLGSGVIYNTSDHVSYIFTALHCILGNRLKDSSKLAYERDYKSIGSIVIQYKYHDDDPFKEVTLSKEALIEHRERDFAILLITREQLQTLGADPHKIYIKKTATTGKFTSLGYPFATTDEHMLLESNYKFSSKGMFTVSVEQASGEDFKDQFEGYSGSGLFVERKPILNGIFTKVRNRVVFGGEVQIRKLELIPFDVLLSSKGNLPKIDFVDHQKSIEVTGDGVINYEKIALHFQQSVGTKGNLSINLAKAINRLKRDMREDWFPDPLGYSDMLTQEHIYKILTEEEYSPSKAQHFEIPKRGFTSRSSIETTLIDRVVYQALVDKIAEELDDRVVRKNVYSFRYNTNSRDGEYMFFHPIEQWKKFLHQVHNDLSDENPVLVVTDLTGFFESIVIDHLIGKLKHYVEYYLDSTAQKSEFHGAIELLRIGLNKWSRSENIKIGIPQNRDASSFLANLYLSEVDDRMLTHGSSFGFTYYRYMDDIRMVCSNRYVARRAIKLLTEELRPFGQHLNSKKTQIIFKTDRAVKEYLPDSELVLEQIDSLIRSRRARDIQVAVPMTSKFLNNLIANANTDESDTIKNRKFSFCIERMQRFARAPYVSDSIDFSSLVEHISEQLLDQPWATASFTRFLRAIDSQYLSASIWQRISETVLDVNKNIYEWQSYLIWHLMAHHRYSNPQALVSARLIVDQANASNKPGTAGAIIYLATMGEPHDKDKVLRSLRDDKFLDHLTRRSAVIALRKYDPNVIGSAIVDKSLMVAHATLHAENSDVHIAELPKLRLKDIYRDLEEIQSLG